MIDIDETEKQVKLLQSKSFIRMQLDLPEVLELIERVRRAENARDGWASNAMEYANAITVRDNALIAQAEATLALVEQQRRIADWLESCPRNYQDAPIVETRNGGES